MSWTRSIFFTMYVSYHSGLIFSSLEWTILEAGGDNVSNQSSSLLWNSPLSSVVSHGILTSTDLTDRSSLSWTPRLESCCLPSSFLSVSWSPPSHGPCSKQPKSSTSSPLFLRIRSSRACPFINNTVIHVMNLSHPCTYLDFLWSVLLAFQQILDTSWQISYKIEQRESCLLVCNFGVFL